MKIFFKNSNTGIIAEFKNKKYNLIYPKKIWNLFSSNKEAWIDNIAYLQTVCMPFVSGFRKINYNTGNPYFQKEFNELIKGEILGAVENQKNMNTKGALNILKETKYTFRGNSHNIKKAKPHKNRSIIPLSLGKDSLLTLGLSKEIDLNPIPVYINDTLSRKENNYKIKAIKKIARQEKLKHEIIENQIEKLNDFETWNTTESCLGYMHMMSGFTFLSIPIAEYYNAKYIILGNENTMDYNFLNKDNLKAFPSFGQTSKWTKKQNNMLRLFGMEVFSLIEPLRDILLFRILHKRYPKIGKYQMSCADLDASNEKRWCHQCSTCSNAFINLLANGINPKKIGFRKNMLEKRFKEYYPLFDGKEIDIYERNQKSKLENMLSFYLAYQQGANGYIIDLFKKKFLKEAIEREDELRKKFFKIHPSKTIPNKLKGKILSIYKEELSDI